MKRIAIFLGFTFTLSWTIAFILMANGGLENPYWVIALAGIMLIPALSVVATRLITKEGFKDFGLKPNFKGNILIYIIAWFGPALLILLGALLYFLIFPSHFDLTMSQTASQLASVYEAQGMTLTKDSLFALFITQFIMGLFLSPLLNIITTSGEEIGWRGYLLPQLMNHYDPRLSVLISGAIWGLWHAPIIAMGYNYGIGYSFFPWGGIFAMILLSIFIGTFFSYLSIRTKSFLPAAIAHGSLNGFAAISVFFTSGNPSPFIGPLPTGIIGGIGFLIVGIICFVLIGKDDTMML